MEKIRELKPIIPAGTGLLWLCLPPGIWQVDGAKDGGNLVPAQGVLELNSLLSALGQEHWEYCECPEDSQHSEAPEGGFGHPLG